MKKVLGCIKKAVSDFQMIEHGDIIAVGLSGGKDSMTLLYALHLYQHFSPVKYDLKAVTVTMGFPGFNTHILTNFCKSLGVEHFIEESFIGKVIFEERKEKNPCSLCATMRRGKLNKTCKKIGATKLALGHHGDDAIETMFLNMLYESRIHTFSPVTYFERAKLTMIRPMIYATEEDIKQAASHHKIPIVTNPCPANGNTKREYVKHLVNQLDEEVSHSRKHLLASLWSSNAY